ncbi:MAG: HAMP domain-containing histidine kinase [Kangiellaceae bacterium]|nr:HAMP domain-containing histidine kinase [Kangiellaceae bacterium]MCW9000842.1 HAMP domain-containing histidine kinase [Kangiellaceae bacterium]MCW9017404.1 HAMP domain-containing histidine kinase [Kangiellaceae bacterium]
MVQDTSSTGKKPSIKKTTVSSSISGILIISIIALVISNEFITQWLTRTYDENLIAKVNLLQTIMEYDSGSLEFDFADEFMPEYSRPKDPEYFQIWINNGVIFEKSHSMGDLEFEFRKLPLDQHHIFNSKLPDGRAGRVVYISFYPQIDINDDEESEKKLAPEQEIISRPESLPIATIAIAKERLSLDDVIAIANSILFGSSLILVFILTGIVWWSVKKGLKPLDELQDQIEVLDFKQDNAYLALDREPQELHTLINRFNRMLDSVREGFKREQQFSSDVAHELKTPISEIRTISEVALLNNTDDNNYTHSLKEIKDVSVQMGDLVNQLLALARSEVQKDGLKRTQLDVEQLIQNTVHAHKSDMLERDVEVTLTNNCDPYIYTLSLEFSQIVNNLISNAIRYCPQGSSVSIIWKNTGEKFSLVVSNIAQNLQGEDLKYMFKRLWKKDLARSDVRHSGIGLSLVKAYCEALDYTVNTQLKDEQFSISISGFSHG